MSTSVELQTTGYVLGSNDPDALIRWYLEAFPAASEAEGILGRRALMLGGIRILFDQRDDVKDQTVEPQRVLVNVFVSDIKSVERDLNLAGTEWIRPVESIPPFGHIATFTDGDGNYLQLLQRDPSD